MSDPISVGVSGLLAFQRAISTVGNNIANANTPGYSRQTVSLTPLPAQQLGSGFVGSGVSIGGVTRITNDFLTSQLRTNQSNHANLQSYYFQANRVDQLIAEQSTSVSQGIANFYDSLSQLNEAPSDAASRQSFLNSSENLVSRFNQMYLQLGEQSAQIGVQIQSIVSEVNRLAKNIAEVNNQVISAGAGAPDLLDLRDNLVSDLSKYIAVSTVEQSNGAINVTIGNGQVLVINSGAVNVGVQRSPDDPETFDIVVVNDSDSTDITNTITGGQLAGLLNFTNEVFSPTRNTLGQLALAVADTFNEVHQQGMDLNGDVGGLFFADINTSALQLSRASDHLNNTGTGALAIEISDVGQLTTSDYEFIVTGPSAYSITRLSDNTTTSFTTLPHTIDGMTITLDSGALATGDSFRLMPTRSAANDIAVFQKDRHKIALASPIRTQINTNNVGNGQISAGEVIDTSNAAFTTTAGQLSPPIRVEFLSTTSYQIVNATTSGVLEGPIAFTPGQAQDVFPTAGALDFGYRVQLSGTPQAGDTFTISYNTGGTSDNRNGLAMANLQLEKTINGNRSSFQDVYASLIADIGGRTAQARTNQEASQILLDQAELARDAELGVNLDEEAALLLQYEQAYRAAGQVVSISSRLFEVIFSSLTG